MIAVMDWGSFPINFITGNIVALAVCYTAMKALIKIQREHIQELNRERDDYRDKLHSSRQDGQKSINRIAELESRPDLRNLGDMISGHTQVLNALVEKLNSRDAMFSKVEQAFVKTTGALEHLTALIDVQYKKQNGKALAA